MVDYRAIVAFLVQYYVFVVIAGMSAILYMLPDFQNSRLSILAVIVVLALLYLVILDREVNDIKMTTVK